MGGAPLRRRAGLAALLLAGVLGAWPGARAAQAEAVTDAAGRVVAVPAQVERVFPAGPPAGLVLFSLAPERMVGWTLRPAPAALAFLGPQADKPVLGWLAGRGGDANLEAVLQRRPDLIVDIGMTSGTYVSLAERVQQATSIPVLLLDGRLTALPGTYRTLGAALGVAAAGAERADWIAGQLGAIATRLQGVPAADRPKVYLARGTTGLESARAGAINVEAVEAAGGRNVVGEALGAGSLVTVSMEQLLAFDPDVIVALDPGFFARMRDDPAWRELRAVTTGKVVLAPQLPFPWVDYPPSVNRVIGVVWLATLLHPAIMDIDLRGAAKEFYRLFYHHALTDAELDGLMKDARFQ
ncbi:ABC transporter substrate-binding protein [Xanthobacter sp. V4C-4]|uniref:ABC transporter substrate-binding protein n=1 Tax=Xanthobacter cornucopiae TaxID=3119924 RepID=UPI00372B801B